jgi:hypothetical protein
VFFARDEGKEKGAQGWNSTLEALDAATAAGMHKLYEDAIGSGGHPNELTMKLALKTAVETAIGVAETVAVFSRDTQRLRRAS